MTVDKLVKLPGESSDNLLVPVSVNPSPEEERPPRCLSGETTITDLPILTT